MSPRRTAWLLRLYPHAWRERYGEEFRAVLEDEDAGPLILVDVLRAAAIERIFHPMGRGVSTMQTYPASLKSVMRSPSAYIPLAMSVLCWIDLILALTVHGFVPETPPGQRPDEGVAAHIFQLLLVGQMPFVAWFAIKWLPRDWKAALTVLALQFLAIVIAFVPVWVLEH